MFFMKSSQFKLSSDAVLYFILNSYCNHFNLMVILYVMQYSIYLIINNLPFMKHISLQTEPGPQYAFVDISSKQKAVVDETLNKIMLSVLHFFYFIHTFAFSQISFMPKFYQHFGALTLKL